MWWKPSYGYSKLCNINTHTHTHTNLIHRVAIFTILYGNYQPPHGEFKLTCIGKFARWTWLNFTQQYGKNRQRCQKNIFYYSVWQLLLYFYREFPSKILFVHSKREVSVQFITSIKFAKLVTVETNSILREEVLVIVLRIRSSEMVSYKLNSYFLRNIPEGIERHERCHELSISRDIPSYRWSDSNFSIPRISTQDDRELSLLNSLLNMTSTFFLVTCSNI